MTVQPGLCRTWSETKIVGFLTHRLIFEFSVQFQELPGDFGYSELKLFFPKFRDPAKIFAWMTGRIGVFFLANRSHIYFFFFLNSVLCPFQDYFSSYETGQLVGGGKREHRANNHLAHPRACLTCGQCWARTHTRRSGEMLKWLRNSALNRSATGAASTYFSSDVKKLVSII